eukprot:CAMPEP_0197883110 /NCGR_PEP_ID=MMETSP1439-20131203/10051_1 /TAXON_ID=66791 /ORGANISM="Gonyaulax spinifera, Strain CCMP409" /LENGTH=64 /DNA_ID=CAMNT_0043502815 /DNA_START=57 /DNA_END=248 /DNA_ORIENTATION=+
MARSSVLPRLLFAAAAVLLLQRLAAPSFSGSAKPALRQAPSARGLVARRAEEGRAEGDRVQLKV